MPSVLTTPQTTADPLSEAAERLRRVEESLDETGKMAREVIDSYKRNAETWREVSRNYARAAENAAQASEDYDGARRLYGNGQALMWGVFAVGCAVAIAATQGKRNRTY